MVYLTIDGRLIISGLKSDEGDLIRTGTLWLVDGTLLILPVDHNIPAYAITSTLHDKGLVGDILSYNIKIECTNNVDPGNALNVSIPIPAGFTLETWNSDNGEYDPDTGIWTPTMEGQECSINIIVTCTTTGSQSQTVTLNDTGDSLTSTCTIQATDTDGAIYYTDIPVTNVNTLANLQDGETYTVMAYGYVNDSTLADIHDGVYNNRMSVLNEDFVDNLVDSNIATATSKLENTSKFSRFGATISSSDDIVDIETGKTKSLKIVTNGEGIEWEGYRLYKDGAPATPGEEYTIKLRFAGASGSVRAYIYFRNIVGNIIENFYSSNITLDGSIKEVTVTGTAPANTVYLDAFIATKSTQSITYYLLETIVLEGSSVPDFNYMDINTGDLIVGGNRYIGEKVSVESQYQKLILPFQYDSANPLTIRLYGQYQTISTTCDDRWAGIGLYQGYQTEYSAPVNLLSDPPQLLDDIGSSNITLDSNSESATYVYDVTVPVLGNALDFFTGAELTVNSFANSNSSIEVYLENGEGVVSNTKSSFISTTGKITFGDMADLWGLGTDDVEGQTIQVVIKFTNTTRNEATFSYSNIQLKLYYVTDETGSSSGFRAKGTHSMNYQLFVQEVEIPEGPDRYIGTVNFPLSDGETIVNYSLKSKEIKVNFVVWGNTLDEAKLKLRNINKWLTNDRNTLSIPEPYDLIFDFEDDMSYQVILGEPIDTEIQYTSILCEATFTVESGVALTTEEKITGPVGSNDGIVKIKPVVTVLCDGSATITITDSETSQSLKINTTITDGTIITIDCENRTVTDENGTDYTTDVDIESIWFHFTNDYNISSTGGIVQSVAFNEGY
jgi:hypothetical protein